MVLDAFRKECGDSVFPVVEKMYYDLGKAEGLEEKEHFGCLLDIYVRPHCYTVEHLETSEERIEYRVIGCPYAEVVKEKKMEEFGRHICEPWHKGFAEAMGYQVKFCEFLLDGDECCHHIWERKG